MPAKSTTPEQDRATCERFAIAHRVIFEDEGEVGFGRSCVGFVTRAGGYVSYNPRNAKEYELIEELVCPEAEPPEDAPDAYHKHDCMAILGRGASAIGQLAAWVRSLERAGKVAVVQFETEAEGLQLLTSGFYGYAVIVF